MSKRTMCAALLLLAVPGIGTAQQPRGWVVSGSLGQAWFGKAATGEATNFGPSSGMALNLGITRHFDRWEASLLADSRPSVLRASDSVSVLQLSSLSFGRTGLTLALGRTLTCAGAGSVIAGAGLRLDGWTLPENEHRWRTGAEAHAALRYDLGPLSLENRLTLGISGSPFDASDLPDGYERRMLKWMEVAIGVRVGL